MLIVLGFHRKTIYMLIQRLFAEQIPNDFVWSYWREAMKIDECRIKTHELRMNYEWLKLLLSKYICGAINTNFECIDDNYIDL